MNHPISQQLQALHQAVNSNDAAALQQLYKDDAVLVDKPFISEHRDIHGALHEFKSRYMPEHVVSHGDESTSWAATIKKPFTCFVKMRAGNGNAPSTTFLVSISLIMCNVDFIAGHLR